MRIPVGKWSIDL